MKKSDVRVRIAPSPTGYLHVGTARTALFNYLYARHYEGKFLVRIEDTDLERSDNELIEPILEALRWLGIDWDEDIIYQSQRLDKYRSHAETLIELGQGYRCFCTPEQLQEDREEAKQKKLPMRYNRQCLNLSQNEIEKRLAAGEKFATRIRIPDGETTYRDMVSGDITRQNEEIEDFVVARSDGSATYNLAVVVDDHEMGISHVIRGNDHITNTFKQIHIYRALGWDEPEFGHVPLILRPDKKKVSKRLGDKDVAQYQEEGIIPQAMFNYLALLGWNPKTDREIYTPEELVELFDPAYFNASNAIFDEDKLVAFNQQHLQNVPDHQLAATVAPMLVAAELTSKYWLETRWEYLCDVIALLKPRARRVSDFVELSGYFFNEDFSYNEEAAAKQFTPEAVDLLTDLADRFEKLTEFDLETTAAALGETAEVKGVKKGGVIHPTRLAVSGRPDGPGLYDILVTLGQHASVARMRRAANYIRNNQSAQKE